MSRFVIATPKNLNHERLPEGYVHGWIVAIAPD
jgi:hypothetical protein